MTNYRNSKLVERYEDVVFELDTALNTAPANNASQRKEGHRFVVDNSGESVPFDWYHARFNVDFKLQKLADGANVANGDHNGIVTVGRTEKEACKSLCRKFGNNNQIKQ